jgi:hypothetical protein
MCVARSWNSFAANDHPYGWEDIQTGVVWQGGAAYSVESLCAMAGIEVDPDTLETTDGRKVISVRLVGSKIIKDTRPIKEWFVTMKISPLIGEPEITHRTALGRDAFQAACIALRNSENQRNSQAGVADATIDLVAVRIMQEGDEAITHECFLRATAHLGRSNETRQAPPLSARQDDKCGDSRNATSRPNVDNDDELDPEVLREIEAPYWSNYFDGVE